jgi:hypothetical protein
MGRQPLKRRKPGVSDLKRDIELPIVDDVLPRVRVARVGGKEALA